MSNNNQQPPQKNPNNQFSNNEPMTFAQKVEYVKSIEMTNNKQQTAVEWLADKIEILHYDYWAEHISKDEKNQRLKQLKEQANAMHKEEIIKAHGIKFDYSYSQIDPKKITGEQYYQQNYGNDKQ